MTASGVIPVELRVVSFAVLAAFLGWVLWLLRTHRLSMRDSLVWLVSTLLAAVLALFPGLLVWASGALGFQVASNALFGAALLYLAVNVLVTTVAGSQNAARARRLAQECALLRAEIDELRAERGRLPPGPAGGAAAGRAEPGSRPGGAGPPP